ncbi:MAG: hypothetical protein JW944_09340 [Deltaproteobacteria bacterium]|nr:hypothetical protein [Deltaproteobacteria bacterium]
MFTISGISNSYISQALYNSQDNSITNVGDTSAQVSDLSASDIVTLSSESMKLLEDLINSTGEGSSLSVSSSNSPDLLNALYNSTEDEAGSSDASSGSLDLLNVLLNSTVDSSDYSTGSLYDVLISAQNEKLIKNNPELVNMILSAEETDSTGSSSDVLSTSDDINLVTISANEILNIIEKYKEYSSSTEETGSSSLIDETV